MLTRLLADDYLLLLLVLTPGAHLVVKTMLIMRYRQMAYFTQKLKRSFFYYDGYTIKEALELRIKKYYKLSNKVNTAFYTLMMLLVASYLLLRLEAGVQQVHSLLSAHQAGF